ncbi:MULTISPECIES: alpha/beta fold hydrolase [Thiorhodovibrio]|uniref:alpha/beta fold hydrolase n=1 Tax=Thiorhodovibrio TaxID=61593 RepID=UPI001914892A|nr:MULTISPECIES: alpha/beta hydrolase [Thiorhodovibrio]MBK5969914.1 alpha/beta hydrolase [Thiorhodovibrio winogradskyi]WPL12041.1 acetoin dehydrogenase E2 subunit dihydrolipoyllysine-residue acetyltransferase [Thiorhodovibrio litoralis]
MQVLSTPSHLGLLNAAPTDAGGATPNLPAALDAPRARFAGQSLPELNYYVDGPADAEPILLIHSINAAPSAFEMKPLFDHYRATRRVYALELPGFGFSDRSDRVYSPELYADSIRAFLSQVVKAPCDLIAYSLSCEFAARAALQAPEVFRRLVLLSPTGFSARRLPSAKTGRVLHRFFSLPGFGPALYALVTIRPSVGYFMQRSFVTKPPKELIDYAYATSHQPGARYAPFYFLSGQLFTHDPVEQLYAKLQLPVLVIHDRDANVSFDLLPDLDARKANWQVSRVEPTLGMPQWEQPQKTIAAIDAFWQKAG